MADKVIKRGERIMIVTLTIKDAENLTSYLKEKGYKVAYLHNENKTLERTEIIYNFRKGKYDLYTYLSNDIFYKVCAYKSGSSCN